MNALSQPQRELEENRLRDMSFDLGVLGLSHVCIKNSLAQSSLLSAKTPAALCVHGFLFLHA
jgi:hypothetical protein